MLIWLRNFLLLAAVLECNTQDSVNQSTRVQTASEHEMVKLHCTYSTSDHENVRLYWYRQYPNREPHFLLYKYAPSLGDYEDTSDDRFHSATTQTSTELTITDVRLSDSALYYCALRVGAQ
uniref:Ig-like domain-containing protein n=1 Tax=Cyprinus carpio TaxID=7962 RepID=A0A8C1N8D5_CYPCA